MKNIHVLPTDKPSRLYEFGGKFNIQDKEQENFRSFNIYVTNEEKFVRDEYITDGIEVIKATPKLVNAQGLVDRRDWRKIILTTDGDLIKDGVQVIDDEFLGWFVNNPSCEFVQLLRVPYFDESGFSYKIIIPQEEPKQEKYDRSYQSISLSEVDKEEPKQSTKDRIMSETSEETKQKARDYGNSLVNKQETFEEAKKYLSNEGYGKGSNFTLNNVADLMLEWQQEQDKNKYNEEEVLEFTQTMIMQYKFGNTNIEQMDLLKETLQQFKNK